MKSSPYYIKNTKDFQGILSTQNSGNLVTEYLKYLQSYLVLGGLRSGIFKPLYCVLNFFIVYFSLYLCGQKRQIS